jgi:hypothetical protein
MKKTVFAMALLSGILTLNSCKGDKKTDETTPETTIAPEAQTTPPDPTTTEVVAPKSYTVNVAPGTPETILLGKNKEASVKILNLKAVELSDPDGKSTGTELSYDIELTNKNAIGGNSVSLFLSDFRLELDNGTKISHYTYNNVSTEPESTKTSTGNIFKLPVGTKPTALNLFSDETRVSVKLEIK